jgi:hypothetical protein
LTCPGAVTISLAATLNIPLVLPILLPPHAHAGKDVPDTIEVTSLARFYQRRRKEVAEKVSLDCHSEHSEESVLPKKPRKSGFLEQTPPSE